MLEHPVIGQDGILDVRFLDTRWLFYSDFNVFDILKFKFSAKSEEMEPFINPAPKMATANPGNNIKNNDAPKTVHS